MNATDPMPSQTPGPDAPVEVQDDLASVRRLNRRPRILAAGGIFALILITLYGASQLGGADDGAELEEAAAPAVPATPPSVLAADAPRGVIPPAADDGRPVPPLVLPGADETPTLIGAAPGARSAGGVPDSDADDYAELLREHELARRRYFLGRELDAQKSADTAARTAYGAETRIAAVESALARRDDDNGPGPTGLGLTELRWSARVGRRRSGHLR